MEAQLHKIIIAQFNKQFTTKTTFASGYSPRSYSTDVPPPRISGYIDNDLTQYTPTICFLADEDKFFKFEEWLDNLGDDNLQLDELYIFDRYTLDGEDMIKKQIKISEWSEELHLLDEHKDKWFDGRIKGCQLWQEHRGFTPTWKLMSDVQIKLSDGTFEPLRVGEYVSDNPAHFFNVKSAHDYAKRENITNYQVIEIW
jgi:hypothetical protein